MLITDFPIKEWDITTPIIFNGRWVHNWFSNMIICHPITDEMGLRYKSVENYYQASKSLDRATREAFVNCNPHKAKSLGRRIVVREDWKEVQVGLMLEGLLQKWSKEPFRTQLIQSLPNELIEWNNWGDLNWGVPIKTCKGRNVLGILLTQIRAELKKENKDYVKYL